MISSKSKIIYLKQPQGINSSLNGIKKYLDALFFHQLVDVQEKKIESSFLIELWINGVTVLSVKNNIFKVNADRSTCRHTQQHSFPHYYLPDGTIHLHQLRVTPLDGNSEAKQNLLVNCINDLADNIHLIMD